MTLKWLLDKNTYLLCEVPRVLLIVCNIICTHAEVIELYSSNSWLCVFASDNPCVGMVKMVVLVVVSEHSFQFVFK